MPRDLLAYLWDIKQAAEEIHSFTQDLNLNDYQQNSMLRAAVERKFEVIGEALSQALRHFPEINARISHPQQIIAFRNRLIHGYAAISDRLVWDVVETYLPTLRQEVAALMRTLDR